MVFNVFIVLLIAGIAYFHYTQGLLAATVSAFCAAVAGLMAFSFHETITVVGLGAKAGSYSDATVLCLSFAILYSLLRFFTDNLIPGNARYPAVLDKVGAALMGLAAAVFPAGIVALAAQELPFGPSVALYSPLPTNDNALRVPNQLSSIFKVDRGDDVYAFDQLTVSSLTGDDAQAVRQGLWLPVDQWLLGLVARLSDTGSLAASPLKAVYPDWKIAAFADRLGMQRAAQQTAFNLGTKPSVTVTHAFDLTFGDGGQFPADGIPQVDGDVRTEPRNVPPTLKPAAGKKLVVVRVAFDNGLGDKGGFVRFGPASARLVADGKEYFPIGTLESATIAVSNMSDDFLLAERGADLIYSLDPDALAGEAFAPGAFLEFKRFARVDLGDVKLLPRVNKDAATFVLRKVTVIGDISAKLGGENQGQGKDTKFGELRDTVPATPEDPAAASMQPAEEPSGGNGPMDVIRKNAKDRNDAIGG